MYDRNVDPASLSVSQYASRHVSARRCASASRSRETDTINVGFRAEHTDLSLFDNSPPLYYQFVNEFGYHDQQLHPVGRVVA